MRTLLLLILATLCIAACTESSADSNAQSSTELKGAVTAKSGKLNVLTTLPALASMAMYIAGEDADVVMLQPAGTDPHEFEPTLKDRKKLEHADLLIINGLGMEIWDTQELASVSNIKLVDCSTNLPDGFLIESGLAGHTTTCGCSSCQAAAEEAAKKHAEENGHSHGEHNPHIWLSADGAIAQATVIAEALATANPDNAENYRARLKSFSEEIHAVRDQGLEKLAPYKGKSFATEHDAFPYLARETGLQCAAITRIPSDGVSMKRRAELAESMQAQGVKAVFTEPGAFNSTAITTLAKELGVGVGTLDPLCMATPSADLVQRKLADNYQALAQAFAEQ